MLDDRTTAGPLRPEEFLALMSRTSLGRLVVTEGGLPAVHLVGFALDGRDVVFPVPRDSSLVRSLDGAVVALQADHIDRRTRTGWSVLLTGWARRETDPASAARALGGPRRPAGRLYFRLSPELARAQRIGPF
jgi:hypothetical protein